MGLKEQFEHVGLVRLKLEREFGINDAADVYVLVSGRDRPMPRIAQRASTPRATSRSSHSSSPHRPRRKMSTRRSIGDAQGRCS